MTIYPLSEPITETLATHSANLSLESFSDNTLKRLKLHYLDFYVSAYCGNIVNREVNQALIDLLASPAGKSSILFATKRASLLDAAFLNAAIGHGADLDDGNKIAAGHPGVIAFATAMSVAEDRGLTNERFLESALVGYEVFCRLGAACMPYMVDRGFHSTGMVGAVAAACAAAKALSLDEQGIYSSIGIVATQASGLLLVGESGQEIKPINPGNAVRAGLLSALMAEKGIAGPQNPLESAQGWCHAVTPEVDIDMLKEGFGETVMVDSCYLKSYPSCRHTHSGIQAAIAVGQHINPDGIDTVTLRTYGHALDLAGRISVPTTPAEAKFSIKYAVAKALMNRSFGLRDLDVGGIDQKTLDLIAKIELVRDDDYEKPREGIRGAKLIVRMSDGRALEEEVLIPKGDPESPFALHDVIEKLDSSLGADGDRMNASEAESIIVGLLGQLDDLNEKYCFPRHGIR